MAASFAAFFRVELLVLTAASFLGESPSVPLTGVVGLDEKLSPRLSGDVISGVVDREACPDTDSLCPAALPSDPGAFRRRLSLALLEVVLLLRP